MKYDLSFNDWLWNLGTIRCDFDVDWCNFAIQNTGDGASQQGFKWNRRTSDNIKTNTFEGPEQGDY